MSFHNEIGKMGEDMAREFLEQKGYEVIEQNYKTKYSEIDLICQKLGELVFVEVRTKIGENFGTPEDTLTPKKLGKMRFGATSYAAFAKWQGPIKIDAICIVLTPTREISRLTHHQNIA
jgi:putative endonuclease